MKRCIPTIAAVLSFMTQGQLLNIGLNAFLITSSLMSFSQEANAQTERSFVQSAFNKSQNGDQEGAILDMNQAIDINPNSPVLFNLRGLIYIEARKYSEAISDFTKAIELGPNVADYYNNRAGSNKLIGNDKSARSDWEIGSQLGNEKSIEMLKQNFFPNAKDLVQVEDDDLINDPKNEESLIRRGLLREKFNPLGALDDYTKAIDVNQKNANVLYFRSRVKYKLGDKSGAISDLEKSISIDPESTGANEQRNFTNYLLDDDFDPYPNAKAFLNEIIK